MDIEQITLTFNNHVNFKKDKWFSSRSHLKWLEIYRTYRARWVIPCKGQPMD